MNKKSVFTNEKESDKRVIMKNSFKIKKTLFNGMSITGYLF